MEPGIQIGTSGWSYKHWRKIYYPEKLKAIDWLAFYAQTFGITELNTSFYQLPAMETTKGWAKKVPKDFMFCSKMSRYLTHMKKLNEPEESFEKFFDVFTPLKRKLGPVLIQLPPSLRFNAEKATHLYTVCKKQYAYYSFAMEVRHASWLEHESLELMKRFNIAFVIAHSGVSFPYAEYVTAQHIYVRFHGPEQLYASSYSDAQLNNFANLFLQWKKDGHSIWAFFNNDVFGYAIENAKRLKEMCA